MSGGSRTGAAGSAADPLRTRRFFLGGLAIGIIAMSVVGLATAVFVESPQQVAARSAAPAATLITAPARWQVLRSAIAVQGIVRSARRIEVTASASYPTVTVTRLPVKAGDRVRPGQLLAEIDGRPILLLRGRLPPYRDLHEGDHGPDVAQLQRALESLGYADFDPAAVYGPSTALALLLFYRHLGYQAPMFPRRLAAPPAAGPPAALPRVPSHAVATRRISAQAADPIPSAYLPMSEVAFIPGRSALVISVGARLGGRVGSSPLLTLATGRPYVTGRLTAHQAAQARAGMPAVITAASPPLTAAGRVTHIGPPGGPGPAQPAGGVRVLVRSRRPLPQRLIGARVRLTLEAAVTAEPVLTVPVAAVMSGRHGLPTRVVKITAARRRISVPVFTGPTADGLVAVQPVRRGGLRPGDRVLVGVGR